MADMPPWLSIIEKSVKANKSLAGFLKESSDLTFITDLRSNKTGAMPVLVLMVVLPLALMAQPACCAGGRAVSQPRCGGGLVPASDQLLTRACVRCREQFRLSGNLQVVGAEDPQPAMASARQAAWNALSPGARTQFGWPQPGLPRDPDPAVFSPEVPGEGEKPSPAFGLLILHVHKVLPMPIGCHCEQCCCSMSVVLPLLLLVSTATVDDKRGSVRGRSSLVMARGCLGRVLSHACLGLQSCGAKSQASPEASQAVLLGRVQVDYLQLFKNERVTYSVEDDWQPHRVNP
ncbi:hypothetical protein QJQ45_029691 [Haematococcus lacustris]|nr:hypothetical protein QJQ45_029691 [Haematococcus lacustris]